MKKDQFILRCDVYFSVSGEKGDLDISTMKILLARDLVSQVRGKNWGSKEWFPGGRLKSWLNSGNVNDLTFDLLTEEETVNAIK
jgi:hypothetical protein